MRVVIVRDEFCSNISHHTKILYTFLHHVEASFVEHTKHSVTIWQTVMDKGQTYMWETHEYDNNDLESTASIFYGIVLSIQHILLRLFGFSLESAKEWPRKTLHTRLRARIKTLFSVTLFCDVISFMYFICLFPFSCSLCFNWISQNLLWFLPQLLHLQFVCVWREHRSAQLWTEHHCHLHSWSSELFNSGIH